ncbi:uncharacterized protein LOC124157235 [Ischnura elegans]|uniref:uncharacterized protein LOC124157235 n=1 Tax=Ischnura elegans TaxID=197161 RepID=UPI001ED8B770|nr:uncharacterized protein LOC124157235 [Ischnura elegans]
METLLNMKISCASAILLLHVSSAVFTATSGRLETYDVGPERPLGHFPGLSSTRINNETVTKMGRGASNTEDEMETTTIGMKNLWLEGINPWTDAPDCCIGFENRDCTKECTMDNPLTECDMECGILILPKTPTLGEVPKAKLKSTTGSMLTLTVPLESLRSGDTINVYDKDGDAPKETITCNSFTPDKTEMYIVSDGETFTVTYETNTASDAVGCGGLEGPTEKLKFDTIKKVVCNDMDISENANGDFYGDIASPGYPFDPYPQLRDCTWNILAPSPGYGIELQVKEFDLDGAYGDYVHINAGPISSRSKGYLLTWSDTKSHVFKILPGGSATVYFHSGLHNKPNERKGFHIIYKHLGNGTLPASTTTSGPEMPTPPPGFNANFTLYIAGKTPEEFDHDKNSFKDSLVTISNKYCHDEQIFLTDPISFQDVMIHSISHCPPTWPFSQECAEVTIQIVAKTVSGDYELTDVNLQKMWDRYGWDRDVTHTGITPYERNKQIVIWWLIGAVAVLVIFIVILLITWYFMTNPHQTSSKPKENTSPTPEEKTTDPTTVIINNKAPFTIIEDDDNDDEDSFTSDHLDSYYDYEGSTTYSNYNDSSISGGKINPAYIHEDDDLYEINLGADDFKFKFVDKGINYRSGNKYNTSSPEKVLRIQSNEQGENSETIL